MSSGKAITLSLRRDKVVAEVQFVTFGWVIKASVDGQKGHVQISGRFSSKSAAEDYCQLAIKQGFKDAFVSEVTGIEANKKEPTQARNRHFIPPQS